MLLWTCIQAVSYHGHSEINQLLICSCELAFREWVTMDILKSFNCWHAPVNLHLGSESPWTFQNHLIADMLLWTCIQAVSQPGHSDFNCWYAPVNLHPGSESSWTFWAQIQLLTCSCELASREWVTVDILSSNSIADMLLWTCIQGVSHHGYSELKFSCWHAPVNLHPESESSRTFWAQIQLLICSYDLASR